MISCFYCQVDLAKQQQKKKTLKSLGNVKFHLFFKKWNSAKNL